ncbi:MAG: MFS transporter [Nitrososphaerota archaeon]
MSSLPPSFLFTSTVLGLSISALIQMSPVLAAQLGASYTEIGLAMGAARLTPYVVLSPMTGLILRRVGGDQVLALSAAFTVGSHILLSMSKDLSLITLAQVTSGLSMAFYYPVAEIILAANYHGSERMRAFSKFGAASAIGFLAGSILSGLIAQYLGLARMFMVLGVSVGLTIPYMLRTGLRAKFSFNSERNLASLFKSLIPAFSVTLPFYMIFGIAQVIIPGYAALTGISELEIGVLFLGMWVTRILASIIMAKRAAGNIGRYFIASGSALAALLSTTALSPGLPSLTALLMVMGAVISVIYILTLYLTSARAEGNQTVAIGAYETIIGVAFLTGIPIAGLAADMLGVPTLFLGMALLSLASGFAGYISRR